MATLYPAILLDLDGTIVDSQPGILSSCEAALRALGHVPQPSLDISALIGPPIEEIMRLLLKPYDDDRVNEAVSAYRADYGPRGLYKSTIYPGISQALAGMQQTDAKLFLATSKRRDFAETIINHFELTAFFEGIYGAEPEHALNHKTEIISHIIKSHELIPDRCVMVGDTRYDIAGAHANKVRALGVLWGYSSRNELEAAGADGLVAEPGELSTAAVAMANMG